jgi:NAD(P)-dependent dehydrogenase (short-subunit alcohol dehydrogenase family)
MGKLDGKVAVITGGASGMGAGTVRRFVAEGARVVLADVADERGRALVAELGAAAVYAHTDVAREEDVAAAVASAVDRWGRLDCIFNNAGFGGVDEILERIPVDAYQQTMDVLLKGVLLGIKHAAPIMKRQHSGSIINTGSVAGLQAGYGPHVYSVAKAAVIHLSRCAAMELGEWGVRVNCICPGAVLTNIAESIDSGGAFDPKVVEAMQQRNPRLSQPLEVARGIVFLASEEASSATGAILPIDGGSTA